ncbi:MAG TPA: Calx-beta domain-containing protein [Crinalium sp.]
MPTSTSSNNTLTLVQIVNTSQFSTSSPDPDGIVYIPDTNSLLISDSEVDEIPNLFTSGKNLYNVSLSGTLKSTLTTIPFSHEPSGVAYNPTNKHLYFSDDDHLRILDLNPGADGKYNTADDSVSQFDVSYINGPHTDPEDVAYSSATGDLFIMDGFNSQVYRVTTSGKLISQFDTESQGVLDPEGIAIGPNGNLFIVGNPATNNNAVYEFTTDGTLVGHFDISAAKPIKPAGLTFAPSSNNANQLSLYIVDRGVDNNVVPTENDGRLYEFSFNSPILPTPGSLAFSAPTFSVNEDGTTVAKVQVTRTGGSSGAVSVTVNPVNGTAIAPTDYNGALITVNFADGDTAAKTVTIPIVNDSSVEGNETVNLSLINPTGGAAIGAQSSAVLTIVDDDVLPTPTPTPTPAPTPTPTPIPTPTPTPIVTPTPTPVPVTTTIPNIITGTDASETLIGTPVQDIINAAGGNDILIGLDDNDTLNGQTGNDKAFGNAGDDILNGGQGNDTLYGELGNDQLNGGAGKDVLVGGLGNDILTGGAGKDKFVYKSIKDGVDHIKDFNAAQDVIVLKGLFHKGFKRSHLFSEYVKLSRVGSNTVVKVDVDGLSGNNHFTSLAVLEHVKPSSLSAKNFVV